MTARSRAFVGLGGNLGDRVATLQRALTRIDALEGTRLCAVSAAFENPAVGGPPQPDYVNAVAEVATSLAPEALLRGLHRIEDDAGRVRREKDGPRTLDLDLLAHTGAGSAAGGVVLPHPRALDRAFTLEPWAEIAPTFVVPGTGASVARLCGARRAVDPAAFASLRRVALLRPAREPAPARRPIVLEDRGALAAWREAVSGTVGFVPTMGALHEGHAALARRARATSDVVVASIFVNPLQFGPTEDLSRYPRTFDADLDLLGREGVDAVYAPAEDDLYGVGFSTSIDVGRVTERFEGALRPGHFRGVATVVAKLLVRARPDLAFFGRKDAQQVALVERLVRDLDLPGEIVVAPTVRDVDGLALSSRNRYLSASDRARALALPRALAAAARASSSGATPAQSVAAARDVLARADLVADYLDVVDPASFASVAAVPERDALLVAAVRVGSTRLLDNVWICAPVAAAAVA